MARLVFLAWNGRVYFRAKQFSDTIVIKDSDLILGAEAHHDGAQKHQGLRMFHDDSVAVDRFGDERLTSSKGAKC